MDKEQTPAPESNRTVKRVSGVMAAIGAAMLGVMMLLSVADVTGRKFFLHPIEGTNELVGILLVIAASTGLGYCALMKAHLRITILYERFSRRGQAIIDICAYVMCIAASALITWQGSLRMVDYIFKELGGRTAILSLPLWPFMGVMVISFTWLTVVLIINLVNSIKEVTR
jgi:TRAP-type C4-dicarboxylate transport system permease small subunit